MWATRTWREKGVVGAWGHVLEMPRAGWGHHGQRAFVLQHLGPPDLLVKQSVA